MLRPQPPTTRTSAPGDSARNGATARHASGRLSLALATAVGGTPPRQVRPAETAHGAAGLDDLRDELVAERKGPRERHEAVHDGVVDVARRDDERAHERVVRRLEARVRSLLPSHRTGLDERQLSHARVPRRETLAPRASIARARGPCREPVSLPFPAASLRSLA